jgi:hypothetical protein
MAEPIGRYNPLKTRPVEESQDAGPVLEKRIGRYNPLKTRPVEESQDTGSVLQKRGGWDLSCDPLWTGQCKKYGWVCGANGEPHSTQWYDVQIPDLCDETCTCGWIITPVL